MKYYELPLEKISLHGACGGALFHAHKKCQRADQLALIRWWCFSSSVALYLDNGREHLASLKLGNQTHAKLRHAETAFFTNLRSRRTAVEYHFTNITEITTQQKPHAVSTKIAGLHHTDNNTFPQAITDSNAPESPNPQPPHHSPALDLSYDPDPSMLKTPRSLFLLRS